MCLWGGQQYKILLNKTQCGLLLSDELYGKGDVVPADDAKSTIK